MFIVSKVGERNVKALRLNVPPSVIAAADEVIE